MRRHVHFISLFSLILFACIANAQHDRFLYAITDLHKDGAGWNALRKMDLKTGEFSQVLLNGADAGMAVYDAETKKPLSSADGRYTNGMQSPFGTGVAAAAYDKKNNRIWYTPMFADQLRYIDLRSMKVFYVTDKPITVHTDEAEIITRMVIAPDGFGYAVSNDGNTFIRFSTGKKIKIENLGSLVDDPDNNAISVHNRCSSFGGDMIADDNGHLYLFTARNHVFKVNIATKVATHLGAVSGLPQNFTINGAAVTDEGMILAGSALNNQKWVLIDPVKWSAVEYNLPAGIVRSSDLANSNYLLSNNKKTVTEIIASSSALANDIIIYPNPVYNNQFTIEFRKLEKGDYAVALTDITGRVVQRKLLSVGAEGQVENFVIDKNTSRGVYLINVTDRKNKSVFTQKLIVQ